MFPLRDYFYNQYLTALNALFRFIFPITTTNNNVLTDGHHRCFPHPPLADPTEGSSLITFDNGNCSVLPPPPHGASPSEPEPVIQPSPLKELPDNALLELGSMVEVNVEHSELYGVIRWIGPLPFMGNSSNTRVMVGIELEEEPMEGSVEITDGVYDNVR